MTSQDAPQTAVASAARGDATQPAVLVGDAATRPARLSAARKDLWLDLRHVPINKRLPYLRAATEAGCTLLVLEKGDGHLGRPGPPTAYVDGKQQLRGPDVLGRITRVHDAKSQAKAAAAKGLLVVQADDWRVIPLENLVAARAPPAKTYAVARSASDARLFATVLQSGVDGILLQPASPAEVAAARQALDADAAPTLPSAPQPPAVRSVTPPLAHPEVGKVPATPSPVPMTATSANAVAPVQLHEATVTRLERVGMAERVCLDCTARFTEGEGLLVGSTARSFLLVLAETAENPLVPARPFRVNAGAVHAYCLNADGTTSYMNELRAGARVAATTTTGSRRDLVLGRAKIELRPHILVGWSSGLGDGSIVLQEAETVRVATADGPRAVTHLALGDRILVHPETAARHTGRPVQGHLEER